MVAELHGAAVGVRYAFVLQNFFFQFKLCGQFLGALGWEI